MRCGRQSDWNLVAGMNRVVVTEWLELGGLNRVAVTEWNRVAWTESSELNGQNVVAVTEWPEPNGQNGQNKQPELNSRSQVINPSDGNRMAREAELSI